jgi:hypothetical protein
VNLKPRKFFFLSTTQVGDLYPSLRDGQKLSLKEAKLRESIDFGFWILDFGLAGPSKDGA